MDLKQAYSNVKFKQEKEQEKKDYGLWDFAKDLTTDVINNIGMGDILVNNKFYGQLASKHYLPFRRSLFQSGTDLSTNASNKYSSLYINKKK